MGPGHEEASDAEILEQVRAGNVDAFERIIARHEQRVFAIVCNHVPAADVEAVAHDVFLRAFRSLHTYSARSPFEHWLSRVALRACCDYWRGEKRRREAPATTLAPEAAAWLEQAGQAQSREAFAREGARREAVELLERALARIAPEDRMVLVMTQVEGYSVKEAAQRLGWSVARAKVHAFRSRHALRKIIERMLQESGEREHT